MSERLYYQDPDCLRFTARLLRQHQESGRWGVVLDRTAFYPEGGGHPPDRGTLNGAPVVDVQESGGEVVHYLEGPLVDPAAASGEGLRVAGAVEAGRRWEFRQQHTGQHIVSAALAECAAASTLSAHLGERYTTVEIDRGRLSDEELLAAESLANRIVTQDLPVEVRWVEPTDIGTYPLRKQPPPGIERLRIVQIPGHDASPCGGLHVRSTGEVGLIQLIGQEKIRGHLRLSWRIGDRAYREARETERLAQELGRELGCPREQLLGSARELKERLRSRELESSRLKRRLGELLAAELRAGAPRLGSLTAVFRQLDAPAAPLDLRPDLEHNPDLPEELLRALLSVPATLAVLAWRQGEGVRWLAGSSPELELDLGALVLPRLELIGGRGGGRGHRFQGVGTRPEGTGAFLSALLAALEKGRENTVSKR